MALTEKQQKVQAFDAASAAANAIIGHCINTVGKEISLSSKYSNTIYLCFVKVCVKLVSFNTYLLRLNVSASRPSKVYSPLVPLICFTSTTWLRFPYRLFSRKRKDSYSVINLCVFDTIIHAFSNTPEW